MPKLKLQNFNETAYRIPGVGKIQLMSCKKTDIIDRVLRSLGSDSTLPPYFGSDFSSISSPILPLKTLIYVAVCIYDTQILNGFFSLSSYVQKY